MMQAEVMEKVRQQVPSLRFPGFKGNWTKRALGDGCEILMCKRIFANQTAERGDVPFYKIGTLGGEPDSYITRAHFEDFKERYNYPRAGETLITCAGTVGKCLQFDGHDSYYQDSNIVWIDNPEEHVTNDFLFLLLSKIDWSKLNSTTITRIYSNDLRALELSIPEALPEQQKIAAFMGAVDRKIQQLKRKQALLEQYKKGVVQQLFSQELRFKLSEAKSRNAGREDGGEFPEWEEKRLGDVAEVYQPQTITGEQLTPTGYPVYGANGIVGFYPEYNHETAQVAVTCRGSTCGVVNLTKPKAWITGNAMVINTDGKQGVLKEFIYYTLSSARLDYLITGSGQPQITGNIREHMIQLPSLEEQSRIAGFLMALDAKVAGVAQAVAAAQKWKRGLLQQMFV
ncbi:MAG: restriction endonuclease subunit S [Flavobacteriales bacterium]|nr:restriction endonuclease subunit S [Flavobacteriales bacterium]